MAESTELDPAALERLRRLGGDVFVSKMMGLFLDFAATKIAEARAAWLAENLAGVGKAAHPIKSSAGNIGAARIQELAARIESLADQNEPGQVPQLIAELESAFARIKPELERRRSNPTQTVAAGPPERNENPPPSNL